MIPDQFKKMFGLNSKQDVNMANNIWKMLDQMAQSSPQDYKNFVKKNIKEGVQDVKQKKQEKQKPYKVKPQKGFRVQFKVSIKQKLLTKYQNKLQEKLDLIKQDWETLKAKFKNQLKIGLNICYSERIKLPLSVSKKQMQNIRIEDVKQIQVFYHSLNGPKQLNNNSQFHYLIVINKNVYQSLIKQQKGKHMLMSLAISYFQQRFQNDKNPLIKLYNPQLYQKLAFYQIQKPTIQISNKSYQFGNDTNGQEILLQADSDIKRIKQFKELQQETKKKVKEQQKKKIIKFKQSDNNLQDTTSQILSPFNNSTKSIDTKKPFIQVLDQKNNLQQNQDIQDSNIPYSVLQKEDEVQIQFLVPKIKSIQQLNLQIGDKCIKLNEVNSKKCCSITLSKILKEETTVAKLKKKQGKLLLTVKF